MILYPGTNVFVFKLAEILESCKSWFGKRKNHWTDIGHTNNPMKKVTAVRNTSPVLGQTRRKL